MVNPESALLTRINNKKTPVSIMWEATNKIADLIGWWLFTPY